MRSLHEPLHAVTWFVWAVAAATCIQVAPNPAYVLVTIGIAWVVVEAHNAGGLLARAFPVLLGVGATFGAVKIVLTVATVHGGPGVLTTLPEATLPRILGGFTVGGTIESEVLAQATAEALVIVGIMGVFGAFNAVVAHDELVASLPRTFHETGLVLTVGLAFVPATIAAIRSMQESDRCRTGGTVVRRGRLLRLSLPLLETGLERAVSLSESLDSRGFGRDEPSRSARLAGWVAFAAVLSLGGTLVALVGRATALAAALAGVAAVLVVVALVAGSRGTVHTRYRRRSLRTVDVAVIVAAVAAVGSLFATRVLGGPPLTWTVSPLDWPPVHPLPLLALGLLALPALFPLHDADAAAGTDGQAPPVGRFRDDAPPAAAEAVSAS